MKQETISDKGLKKGIALIGGGPSALFVLKEIVQRGLSNVCVHIFNADDSFGPGMPYGPKGAQSEHVTNVSCEEIPPIAQPIEVWLAEQSDDYLSPYGIDPKNIDLRAPLPRLLFGEYLQDQFRLLVAEAKAKGIDIQFYPGCAVRDIVDEPGAGKVTVHAEGRSPQSFDHAVLATGHTWPVECEGPVDGYFDSPYPPRKISRTFNHAVGLRGSSLTAIDAVKTLAKHHGRFERDDAEELRYIPNEGTENFRIVMHSRQGILPYLRFHFENPRIPKDLYLSRGDLDNIVAQNGGTVSLDYIFDKTFKQLLGQKDPVFYEEIKDMGIEAFAEHIFSKRRSDQPFDFFANELQLSRISMEKREPLYWKELIAYMSWAVNFTARHMSAEDTLRIKDVLMPCISHIVADLPQASSEELLAMHRSGKLDLVAVGNQSTLHANRGGRGATYSYIDRDGIPQKIQYDTFIDCIGQRAMTLESFPFPSLKERGSVARAEIRFHDPKHAANSGTSNAPIRMAAENDYRLALPGIAVDHHFRAIDINGRVNNRLMVTSAPYIAGYYPDYSGGLDFCEEAAISLVSALQANVPVQTRGYKNQRVRAARPA